MDPIDPNLEAIVEAIIDPTGVDPDTLYQQIEAYVDSKVEQRLQSLGGKLLAEHGPMSPTPNSVLASVGGYLTSMDVP